VNHLAGQRAADGKVDAMLAVDQVTEDLVNGPPVTSDDDVEISGPQRIEDPKGLFPLPLEGLQ